MIVLENNEYIDQYNFSSLITQDDNLQLISIAKNIIEAGGFFTNSPKYQTNENLFFRQDPVMLKMRQSFVYSCFMFLGQEVQIKNISSWIFMTNNETTDINKEDLWHNHHIGDNNGTTDTVSGLWYVHIPITSNPELTGTEFSMNFPNHDNDFFLKPKDLTWSIYPSKLWHRPGITDSKEFRFVFAADMEYYK
jgi:hypothetical protein